MQVSQKQEGSREQRRNRFKLGEHAIQQYLYQHARYRAGERRRWIFGYLSVLPMLAFTVVGTVILQHLVKDFAVPAGTLVLAFSITALLWGWGPGLLLLLLGMLIIDYFFIPPFGQWTVITWANALQVLPFALAAIVISVLSFQRDKGWVKARLSAAEHQRAREELAVLMEAIPQLVWIARPDGFMESGNQHISTYLGVPLEQFNGDQWSDFVHPDDRQKTWEAWQTALCTGHPYEVEHRVQQGSTHTFRWFLTRAVPHKDAQGTILKWFGTGTDIDKQKCTEEALRNTRARIRALIGSNLIGIVCVEGEEEVITDANEAFLQMSGYGQEDVNRGRLTRARVAAPEDAPLFEQALAELAARGQHKPFETELVCKDGGRLPVLVGGTFFQEHPRQIVAFVLNNAARKELDRRKDTFISMASHELKTPLTVLKLQTALLHRKLTRQGISSPDMTGIEGSINTLTRLVDELLDVSRIQAGALLYRQEMVDVDALLREIAHTMQQNHPTHRVEVLGAVKANLTADRDRLGQVFTNLLSNAIKYSPAAETVEIHLSATEDAVTIRVRDHGPGIPQEQQKKIFERFYRAEGDKQCAIPGLGMGLYIVTEIVQHYGGTITVESTVGEGSTFTVIFPRMRNG